MECYHELFFFPKMIDSVKTEETLQVLSTDRIIYTSKKTVVEDVEISPHCLLLASLVNLLSLKCHVYYILYAYFSFDMIEIH